MAEQKKTSQKKTTQSTQRKSTGSNTKKGQQASTKKAAQDTKVKERVRFDQYLADSTPLFFGFYVAVVAGLLGAGKYYMQFTLTNEIFTSSSQNLISYWIALSDLAFLVGLVGLVVVPVVSYYQRHGLRRLGKALMFSFLLSLVAIVVFYFYVNSLPEPEPTQQFPQGLQQ